MGRKGERVYKRMGKEESWEGQAGNKERRNRRIEENGVE